MATAKQLKALRKKHGLGEFRKKSHIKRKKSVNVMARRRKTRTVYRTQKRRVSRRKTGSSEINDLIGMGGYMVAEGFIDSMASKLNIGLPANALETGVGYFLKKQHGVLGNIGKVMFYVNGYQLIKGVMGGGLGNLFGNSNQNQSINTSDGF